MTSTNYELVLVKNGESELLGTFISKETWCYFKHLKVKFGGLRKHDKDKIRLELTPIRDSIEIEKDRSIPRLTPLAELCYFEVSAYEDIVKEFNHLIS